MSFQSAVEHKFSLTRYNWRSGCLTIKNCHGDCLLGPIDVDLSTSDLISPVQNGSVSEEATFDFILDSIVRPDLTDIRQVESYGRFGVLVISAPSSGLGDIASAPPPFFLCSGRAIEPETPIDRCIRISAEEHRAVALLCTPVVKEVKVSSMLEVSGDMGRIALCNPSIYRMALAAAAAVSPFVWLGKVEACDSYDSGMAYSAVDFKQLSAREGGSKQTGYVPRTESGVTVGSGIDLSRLSVRDLYDMGAPLQLRDILAPYLGDQGRSVTGAEALALIKARPLVLTEEEAQSIDHLYFSWCANKIGSLFNAAASQIESRINFTSLPQQFQTAVVSMYLADSRFAASSAFGFLVRGDWKEALASLSSYSHANFAVQARASELSTRLYGVRV